MRPKDANWGNDEDLVIIHQYSSQGFVLPPTRRQNLRPLVSMTKVMPPLHNLWR